MKKFGLFLILALSLFGSEFESEMKNYDEVFVKIKEQRKGLNSGEISSLQDPFKLNLPVASKGDQNTTKYSSARGFMLKAILLNKANINGKWYKVGDMVDDYNITSVQNSKVIIVKDDEKQELTLKNGSKNVGIKIK
ncbi:hypothetical protein [Campylobacter concisus]|uniref:hypothetical protein n=1 Tax=Campylobacter concisus TaxID=199 RepID=UPI0011E65CBD|nr:hypothetical protein [Campylobacter concisus]MBE8584061.1 hypothetical protein [Campylobacter concisus]MBS5827361.1 hypothetical protein [Campylobacter concisus]